jgi:hypothetical protein
MRSPISTILQREAILRSIFMSEGTETSMNEDDAIAVRGTDSDLVRRVSEKLLELVGSIPMSGENAAADPRTRARALVSIAALKSAAISGSLALPPGPLGLVTILPDLYAIWRVQAKLVADIAAVYSKTVFLTRETMLFSLFRHAAAQAVRDLIVRAGERVLVERPTWAHLPADVGEDRREDDATHPRARRV